jgi:hypothetical protein
LAGNVRDRAGETLVDQAVVLLRRRVLAGRWMLEPILATRTDDRGSYRFGGLTPGHYTVAWQAGHRLLRRDQVLEGSKDPGVAPHSHDERLVVQGLVFLGDTVDSRLARAVELRAGSLEERADLEVDDARIGAFEIRGLVSGVPAERRSLLVFLTRESPDQTLDQTSSSLEERSETLSAGGAFRFAGVVPGRYRLAVVAFPTDSPTAGVAALLTHSVGVPADGSELPPPPSDTTLWAEETVVVADEDVTGVALRLEPGIRLAGRVRFKDGNQPPSPSALRSTAVVVTRADGRRYSAMPVTRIEADGKFETVGLPQGAYSISMLPGLPSLPGWFLESVEHLGQSATGRSLSVDRTGLRDITITLTRSPGIIEGRVVGPDTRATREATVYLFPADRRLWTSYGLFSTLLRAARVDEQGRYKIAGVPPGDYRLAATIESERSAWPHPDYLDKLRGTSSAVTIDRGARVVREVRATAIAR